MIWPLGKGEKKDSPCPICGRADWCKVSVDGCMVWCGRESAGAVKAGPRGGWIHRLKDSPDWRGDRQAHNGNGKAAKPTGGGKSYPNADAAIAAALASVKRDHANAVLSTLGPWPYLNRGVGEALRVIRIDLPPDDKQFRPIHPVGGGWALGDPAGLLPLYRLPELSAAGTVYIVEGERCADTAAGLGLAVTTSAHAAHRRRNPTGNRWRPASASFFPITTRPVRSTRPTWRGCWWGWIRPRAFAFCRLPGLTPGSGEDIVDWLEKEGRDCSASRRRCGPSLRLWPRLPRTSTRRSCWAGRCALSGRRTGRRYRVAVAGAHCSRKALYSAAFRARARVG